MISLRNIFIVLCGSLLVCTSTFVQHATAKSVGPTNGNTKVNTKVNTSVKNGVKFERIHVSSVDSTLQELANLDKDIVAIRNTLHAARKSIHTLINGDRPKFKLELQSLIKSGAISLTNKNGLPSIQFKKKQKTGRAFEIYRGLSNLESSINFASQRVPTLAETLKQLHSNSQKAIELAPTELMQSVQSGKIQLTEVALYVNKVNNNALKIKKVPLHMEQVKNQLTKNIELLKSIFQPIAKNKPN